VTKVTYKRKPGAAKMTRNANCLVCNIRTGGAALCNACYDKADARQAQRGHVPPRPLPPRYVAKPSAADALAAKPPVFSPEQLATLVDTQSPEVQGSLDRPAKRHPRDIINEQLRAKAPRAKQVKRISPKLTHDARVARLVDAARARGVGILTTEIETHERKIGELREALALVTGEKKR
jgi:hypothetical protein